MTSMKSGASWRKIIELEEVESTNQYLSDLTGCQDVEHGTVVSAVFQSAGKGHGDASWESEPGKNILASIYLKEPCIPVEKQFYLSKVVSLAISDMLKPLCPGTMIKWPNDIYIKDRKIGGILIENTITGRKLMSSVIGIGLNVNQEHFPSIIPAPASVILESGKPADVRILLKLLIKCLRERYDKLCQGEYGDIDRDYLGNLYRYRTESRFQSGKRIFLATITGVRENGELELRTRKGTVKTYSFKEVQYMP